MALTADQERALGLLREGFSTAQVAERLRVPRPTVWRWQQELAEFADTLVAPAPAREPLAFRDKLRIVAALLVVLLAALMLYLGYKS